MSKTPIQPFYPNHKHTNHQTQSRMPRVVRLHIYLCDTIPPQQLGSQPVKWVAVALLHATNMHTGTHQAHRHRIRGQHVTSTSNKCLDRRSIHTCDLRILLNRQEKGSVAATSVGLTRDLRLKYTPGCSSQYCECCFAESFPRP